MKIKDGWTEYSEEELKIKNTRTLLKILEDIRAYRQNASNHYFELLERSRIQSKIIDEYDEYLHVLKKILSKREHIPNKQEAKVIRQAKAKAKKNR
jgi:hypothetical protein